MVSGEYIHSRESEYMRQELISSMPAYVTYNYVTGYDAPISKIYNARHIIKLVHGARQMLFSPRAIWASHEKNGFSIHTHSKGPTNASTEK